MGSLLSHARQRESMHLARVFHTKTARTSFARGAARVVVMVRVCAWRVRAGRVFVGLLSCWPPPCPPPGGRGRCRTWVGVTSLASGDAGTSCATILKRTQRHTAHVPPRKRPELARAPARYGGAAVVATKGLARAPFLGRVTAECLALTGASAQRPRRPYLWRLASRCFRHPLR